MKVTIEKILTDIKDENLFPIFKKELFEYVDRLEKIKRGSNEILVELLKEKNILDKLKIIYGSLSDFSMLKQHIPPTFAWETIEVDADNYKDWFINNVKNLRVSMFNTIYKENTNTVLVTMNVLKV